MSIPTFEEIMLPLLKYISDGKIHDNKETEIALAKIFGLTDEEINRTYQGQNAKKIFYDRINWAKSYLFYAGLLNIPKRGQFQITEKGQNLLKENIQSLNTKYLLRYDEFKEFYNKNRKISKKENKEDEQEVIDSKTPYERMDEAYKEMRELLARELLQKLLEVPFDKFEEIVLDLLINMGYGGSKQEAKKVTQKTADEGIDGIINEDRLGLDRIYVQAKRWKDTVVGRPEIQKFVGALVGQGAKKGIFITTSTFSKEAYSYIQKSNEMKIVLIDGIMLTQYMIDFNVGVSVQQNYEIKRIDTDYFDE
ncbi:restriction endonuclease [Thermobrachium celere]|uniref:Mrr restriction system protein n=1 Tax=Thermobrachium celere DSM 8682 TaxID=941824 RepID=R7RQC9_9CLOT|nr:restriction endonuclease [Thermobrachium celere]CDF58289.1 Mrr restriction system protein [Thermobrachium celere DSM 8682]